MILASLSEEYDPKEKRMLGNYPQALTHIALCQSAIILGGGDGPWNGKLKQPDYIEEDV